MRSSLSALLLMLLSLNAGAQPSTGLESTWRFAGSKELKKILLENRPAPALAANPSLFQPGPPNGVAETLARTLAATPADQQQLLTTMSELRAVYDKSAAEQGRSNNLASAYAFFIGCCLTASNDKEPTEAANDTLFRQMETAIALTPAVAGLSDADKQEMHDWLLSMAGVTLATYVGATVGRNPEALASARALAALGMRLTLDADPAAMLLDENGLTIIADF